MTTPPPAMSPDEALHALRGLHQQQITDLLWLLDRTAQDAQRDDDKARMANANARSDAQFFVAWDILRRTLADYDRLRAIETEARHIEALQREAMRFAMKGIGPSDADRKRLGEAGE